MKSMTGFAWKSIKLNSSQYDLAIKVVNGRFLEMRFYLPKDFSLLEPKFRKMIQAIFLRGTLEVRIQKSSTNQEKRSAIVANIPQAKQWLKVSQDLSRHLKLSEKNVGLEFLMKSAGVITSSENSELSNGDDAKFLKNFEQTVKACELERQREGKATSRQIASFLSKILKLIQSMESHRKEANKLLMSRMKKRLAQFELDLAVNEQRLSQEIAYQLEKADISEELVRLKEHVKACSAFIKTKGPHGKKLDFFSQELLREINTIGSKSQVTQLTQLVVDAKVTIEQFREQVQNIE